MVFSFAVFVENILRNLQMSSIDGVTSNEQTSQQIASTVSKATGEIGTAQFLQLLVAQLQNQDPMNPVDNQQFVAQLATFSSLEQLISINKGVTKIADGTTTDTSAIA
jgi:flagellar basal-body rod modification protein FlgD